MSEFSSVSREQISSNLRGMGIVPGDILFIRAGLGAIGRLDGKPKDVVLGGIKDALGSDGTLIVPAFVPIGKVWQRNSPVVDQNTQPYTGALSKMVLREDSCVRSAHPSHSFAAIGPHAHDLLDGHGVGASCFEPMRMLGTLGGKMMLLGCVAESPGFSTIHLAQHDLGLSQKHYYKLIQRSNIFIDGEVRAYRPYEAPGCSAGFGRFYKDYVDTQNFVTGYVGSAWTLMVRAKEAYEIEKKVLARAPNYTVCDDAACMSCRITRGYNKRAIPMALLRFLARQAFSRLSTKNNRD